MLDLVQGICIVALAFTVAFQSRTIRQVSETNRTLAQQYRDLWVWVAEIDERNSQ